MSSVSTCQYLALCNARNWARLLKNRKLAWLKFCQEEMTHKNLAWNQNWTPSIIYDLFQSHLCMSENQRIQQRYNSMKNEYHLPFWCLRNFLRQTVSFLGWTNHILQALCIDGHGFTLIKIWTSPDQLHLPSALPGQLLLQLLRILCTLHIMDKIKDVLKTIYTHHAIVGKHQYWQEAQKAQGRADHLDHATGHLDLSKIYI